jgi:hypothetical protein
VFLGWAILSEQITPSILVGAAIIVASVALVVRQESLSRAPAPAPAPTQAVGASATGGRPGRSAPGDVPGP